MPPKAINFLPQPDSIGYVRTGPGSTTGWHTHPFDEVCLVDETATTIGHAGKQYAAQVGAMFLFRRGERHGYWNTGRQLPRLWVIHYHGNDQLYAAMPQLMNDDPKKRIWQLTPEQADTYRAMLMRISIERTGKGAGAEAAQSAWLQLLLVAISRWGGHGDQADLTPKPLDRDLQEMWRIIHDYIGEPAGLIDQLKHKIPNYDSLRHRFRVTVGDSPTRLWSRMRMQRAKNLLLESPMSIKEIATRAGYARQHEFARAFRRQFGISPTDWRRGVSK